MSRNSPPVSRERPIKQERIRVPSPAPSDFTTVYHPPSLSRSRSMPVPTTSTAQSSHGKITLRPLSALQEADDQVSSPTSVRRPIPSPIEPGLGSSVQDGARGHDWRYSCKTVKERLKCILESDNFFHDVVFEVEAGSATEQFRAHKLILRMASPVFDKMFQPSDRLTSASSSKFDTVIPITDVQPYIFKLLLNFIYTDVFEKSDLDEHQLLDLLQLSLKYDVYQLYAKCIDGFRSCMSNEVAVKVCEIASSYCSEDLLEICMTHIARNAANIFRSENFLQLSRQNMNNLLERDDLAIAETQLFEAIMRWGEQQCMMDGREITNPGNLREVLSDIIPKIRFPLMNPDDFTLKVVKTDILTPQEQIEIYRYISVEPTKRSLLPPPSFPTAHRFLLKSRESDSLSDFPESLKSNESPERQESDVASTTFADNANTATEPESETGSIGTASSYNSDSQRRKRNNSGHSSRPRKKSRKDKPGKSDGPSSRLQMNELFGEPSEEACITVRNKTADLNKLISSFRKRADSTERLTLENVTVENYKELREQKLYFPKLKTFTLNIQIKELKGSMKNDLICRDICMKKLLFFTKSASGRSWSFEELWGMKVDITVIVNQIILFKLNPFEKHATLNWFAETDVVLRSLQNRNVSSIVYFQPQIHEKLIPVSVKKITIKGISKLSDFNCCGDFLQQFRSLRELILAFPATVKNINWKVKEKLPCREKLTKIALRSVGITLDSETSFPNVRKLYLWRCMWDTNFEMKFDSIFPRLEEVAIVGPTVSSCTLLGNILKIKSVSKIISWNSDWNFTSPSAEEVRKLISRMSTSKSDKSLDKNFIMLKSDEDGSLTTTRIQHFKEFTKYHAYHMFGYNSLYADAEAYVQ